MVSKQKLSLQMLQNKNLVYKCSFKPTTKHNGNKYYKNLMMYDLFWVVSQSFSPQVLLSYPFTLVLHAP